MGRRGGGGEGGGAVAGWPVSPCFTSLGWRGNERRHSTLTDLATPDVWRQRHWANKGPVARDVSWSGVENINS